MITERRRYERKTLTELVSVELGEHNSGLILNASEGGLAFHAGSPIQAREEIRFAIPLDRSRRLEGCGRLEWTDGNAKTAGLQFTEVSEDFRSEMRLWLAETNVPHEPQERSMANAEGASSFFAADMLRPAFRVELPKEQERPAPSEAHHPAAPKRRRKSKPAHSGSPETQPAPAGANENSEVSDSVHVESNTQPGLHENTPLEQETSSESRIAKDNAPGDTSRRALAALNKLAQNLEHQSQKQAEQLTAGLRGAAAESERHLTELREFAQIQTDRMKDVLQHAGQVSQRLEHLASELEKVQQQKLNYFEAQLQDLSDRHIGELKQRAELVLGSSASSEDGAQGSRTNGWMMSIMLAGLIVLIGAMLLSYHREAGAAFSWIGEKLFGEPQQPAKPAPEVQALEPKTSPARPPQQQTPARSAKDKDARALWSKAARGDTSAEVDLAKLYLAGKGVVKSCVQARLLLGAAADKGNQEATQLLGQLERQGCP